MGIVQNADYRSPGRPAPQDRNEFRNRVWIRLCMLAGANRIADTKETP